MRTTVDIPDELFRAAKRVAADKGCTLRQLMTDALKHELTGSPAITPTRRPLPSIIVPENAPILSMTPAELAGIDHATEVERAREVGCRP